MLDTRSSVPVISATSNVPFSIRVSPLTKSLVVLVPATALLVSTTWYSPPGTTFLEVITVVVEGAMSEMLKANLRSVPSVSQYTLSNPVLLIRVESTVVSRDA